MAGEPAESDWRSCGPGWGWGRQGSKGPGGTELAWTRSGEAKGGGGSSCGAGGWGWGVWQAGPGRPHAPRVSAARTLREMDGVGEMQRGAPGCSWRGRHPRSGGSGGESLSR